MTKEQLLANYLNCDVEDIFEASTCSYETDFGDYFVCNYDEAFELIKMNIETGLQDLGFDYFTLDFQQWILENAVDVDNSFFQDCWEDYLWSLDNAELIDCAYTNKVLINEEDESKFTIDEIRELLSNNMDAYGFHVDYYGFDELENEIMDGHLDLLDLDLITQEAINWDSIAHYLAWYDEEAIDLGEGYFAYRWS